MSEFARSSSSRIALVALLSLFASTLPAAAVSAPPPGIARPKLPQMVDARVNAKEFYQRATAARPGREAAGLNAARVRAAAMVKAIQDLKVTMPGLDVKLSNLTGGMASITNKRGALTAAAPGRSSEDIVRDFLLQNGKVYGLSPADVGDLVALGDSPGGESGLRMLRMEQQIGGRPVFQSETRFLLDRDGRLMKSVGLMVPNAGAAAPNLAAAHLLDPAEAVSSLLAADGQISDASNFTETGEQNGWTMLAENDDLVKGAIGARQVLFPLAPGLLVPAWSLVVFTTGDQDWYAVVDAETGDVLWRKNIRDYASIHDARFRVYVQADNKTPADSPAPQSPNTVTPGSGTQFAEIAPVIVNMSAAQDIMASPNGWIDDCPGGICTANETQTLGNNVLACNDITQGVDADICDTSTSGVLDGNGRPTGNPDGNGRNRDFLGTAPRDFQTNYLPPPQGGAGGAEVGQTCTGAGNNGTLPVDQFRRGMVTQLFYVSNWYHDQLFKLGFDEPAANFQNLNFQGMGGLGLDRVLADADDGSGTNNANFSTPPDGMSGRAQMYRFTGPTIDRDGSLDTVVLMHELTHGTSNRLVGNAAGLNWDAARGMGEGWSDFFALSLTNNTNADNPNGQYPGGAYATYKLVAGFLDNYLYAIRRFPYTTNNAVNPMTWADVDDVTNNLAGGIAPTPVTFNLNGGAEVHNSGEVWALTLWEVRSRIIADPAGANGDVPTGNQTALRLVTNGLKMTPDNPQFIDARDAILDADCATNACANEDSIWGGFADRGLGYGAAEPFFASIGLRATHLGIKESFSLPFLDVVNPGTDVVIDDSAANNNGAIDPGEAVKLNVHLTNPWRAASKAVTSATATLTTSTPGVTIFDNTAAYGAIAPQATVAGSDTFTITVDPSVVCGSSIAFSLSVTSNLGTTVTNFKVRVGAASGTDPVVTYTGDPNPDIAIPDVRPRGVFHQMTVTDDFVIADIDFRIDSITHTFVDDLQVMLRHPSGIGVDMAGLIGLNSLDGGSGDNLTNTLVDGDQPFDAAHDMIQADNTNAPGFAGPWHPEFNSPSFADPLFFGVPADPTDNLSYFDGLGTQGAWTILAADEFGGDVGTLNSWSILVTPVHFACTPFSPAVVPAATKTVSGTFAVGGTITYTVVITNNGTDAQGDNPGHEFTDTLSACLTLVSADDGGNPGTIMTAGNTVNWDGTLAPLGGSVTITITATVNAGCQGMTITNQGTVSYDSNNDNTNDATLLTDDPGAGGTADPTAFTVGAATINAPTKTVSGVFQTGNTVTYTITITNSGSSAQGDNPGNEFTDTLPASLTLVSADDGGSPGTFSNAGNTVNWNGSIPASGTVTITITATINAGTEGQTVCNQGTVNFDADVNGTNESTVLTDDPGQQGTANQTCFIVESGFDPTIPTLSELGLALLGLSLLLAALSILRRRKMTA